MGRSDYNKGGAGMILRKHNCAILNRKLRSKSGETLAEVLMAILIIAIVSAGFATAISSASKTVKESARMDKELFESISDTESLSGTSGNGNVSVSIGGSTTSYAVTFVTDSNNNFKTYSIKD